MWFEEYHTDGIRWDSIPYIRNIEGRDADPPDDIPEGWSLMQWINEEIQQRFPGKISIAEGMHNNAWVTKAVGTGGAGFNAQWDSEFVNPVRQAVIARDDTSRDLGAVSKAIEYRYDLDVFRRVIFTESHDEAANGRARVPDYGKRALIVTPTIIAQILRIIPPRTSKPMSKEPMDCPAQVKSALGHTQQ